MPSDRSELDQVPASEVRERAAALERVVDAPEAPSLRASVPSGIDTEDTVIPNGWFG
jgi:hypothetical protein